MPSDSGTQLLDGDGAEIMDDDGSDMVSNGLDDCPCCIKHCYDVWHYDCGSETINWVSVSCRTSDPAHTNEWNWTGSVYEYIQKNAECTGADAGDCTPSESPPDAPGDTSECLLPCSEWPCITVIIYDNNDAFQESFLVSNVPPGNHHSEGTGCVYYEVLTGDGPRMYWDGSAWVVYSPAAGGTFSGPDGDATHPASDGVWDIDPAQPEWYAVIEKLTGCTN